MAEAKQNNNDGKKPEEHTNEPAANNKNHEERPSPAPKVEPPPSREPKPITITDIQWEQLNKEAAECKDKYLRLLAESENARKRLQKERQELIQYALQNMIVDFLNPIDHLENALNYTQQASDEVKHWAMGFQMILNQFKDVLNNNGVVPFVSIGKPFDPHAHEAVEMVITTESPAGTVIEESIRGYKMGDKTIRPARVKVAKAPAAATQKNEKNEKNDDNKINNKDEPIGS
jgi:molecular chaperone GrpE